MLWFSLGDACTIRLFHIIPNYVQSQMRHSLLTNRRVVDDKSLSRLFLVRLNASMPAKKVKASWQTFLLPTSIEPASLMRGVYWRLSPLRALGHGSFSSTTLFAYILTRTRNVNLRLVTFWKVRKGPLSQWRREWHTVGSNNFGGQKWEISSSPRLEKGPREKMISRREFTSF